MRILRGIVLGVLTLVAASASVIYFTESNAQRELESVVKATNITELEDQIHEQVNAKRAKQSLDPLRSNFELAEIARVYSQDMAKNNFLSHYDLQGRDFSGRYSDAGFTCGIINGKYIYDGAENLYLMNLGKTLSPFGSVVEYYKLDEIAHEVVDGWMKSPGHRENMLTDFWQSEGIGVAVAKDGKIYVTQNFC